MKACLFSFSKACICFGVRLDLEDSFFLVDDGIADEALPIVNTVLFDEALTVADVLLLDEALAIVDTLLFNEARAVVNALLFDAALIINLAEALVVINAVKLLLFDEALSISCLLRDNGNKTEP
jgi:hypothetical protein